MKMMLAVIAALMVASTSTAAWAASQVPLAAPRSCSSGSSGSVKGAAKSGTIFVTTIKTQSKADCTIRDAVVLHGANVHIEYVPFCELGGAALCNQPGVCPDGEPMMEKLIVHDDTGDVDRDGTVCRSEAMRASSQPNLYALIQRAVARMRPPAAELVIQPPGGKTLVNLDTIFATSPAPYTQPVRLLGRRVLVRISPSSYTWLHGDGTQQTTDWAGREWEQGRPMTDYVTHVYTDAHVTVQPRVDVSYTAAFSLDNGSTWRRVPGTVTRAGPATSLHIAEARPVLVGPD